MVTEANDAASVGGGRDAQGALRWTAFAIGRDVRCVVAILKKALALLAVLLAADSVEIFLASPVPLTLSRYCWVRVGVGLATLMPLTQ